LRMIAGVYGLTKDRIRFRVNEMIDVFSLQEVRDKKAKLLSGGMQRRLSIAMALITDPEILFMDEPTLGLDVLARRELWTIITKLKETTTILLTTHYMEEAEALSDKVAVMIKGKINASGTVKDLLETTNTQKLEDAFIRLNQKEA
ncbi:MAG: ATP-binding cassette domain-containing protein, partial [Bacteroidales bacterium]|nr:ATP-binding cassette domain-containing protein [Bacteroidales bacterium]